MYMVTFINEEIEFCKPPMIAKYVMHVLLHHRDVPLNVFDLQVKGPPISKALYLYENLPVQAKMVILSTRPILLSLFVV